MLGYETIKPYIYKFCEPEQAHHLVENLLILTGKIPWVLNYFIKRNFVTDPMLGQVLWNREFPNPVGLAAGYDKNATMMPGIMALGFGHVEIGTVTPKPQPGNEKPRLVRYVEQESVQNAMGFNNGGMEKVAENLKKVFPFTVPIGANIGKNKTTSEENALEDYKQLIRIFGPVSDYLEINISSPNTPGLRDLQNESFIEELFKTARSITQKPVLLKIAPDMKVEQAIGLCQTAIDSGAAGIVATNTTIDYGLLPVGNGLGERGGLSGKVLTEKSRLFFQELAKEMFGKTVLISVGGIDSAEEAYARIKAGAHMVQVYTAVIFKGPSLIREINEGIIELLKQDGYDHISQAIGADIK